MVRARWLVAALGAVSTAVRAASVAGAAAVDGAAGAMAGGPIGRRAAVGVACALTLGMVIGGNPEARAPAAQTPPHTQIVLVVDGLRPDMVTDAVMPRVRRLVSRGTTFTNHHAVFPTVTRVNASTFATGMLPVHHGILGNAIYIPSTNATHATDTADHLQLERVATTEGRLLTAPALGDLLAAAGRRVLVVSSGSPGSALLLAPTATSGTILNTEFFRPAAMQSKVESLLGPIPKAAVPNAERNRYMTDMLLRVGLPEIEPDVVFVWFSEPDTTAHAVGLDTEATRQVLTAVDTEIGRIEDALEAAGRLATTNLIVVSDHGFSTNSGGFDLPALVKPFAHPMPDGTPDIVTAGGAVHLRRDRDPARVAEIVAALRKAPAVGAIFTAAKTPGDPDGHVPGTLSFDLIGWTHPRAGDILVSANWVDAQQGGRRGASTMAAGAAGHGSTNPDDVHNTLIAAGPDVVRGLSVTSPSGNVDLAPTLLHLLGLPVPSAMDGRVLREALRSQSPQRTEIRVRTVSVATADDSYAITATLSEVEGHSYFDQATVTRK